VLIVLLLYFPAIDANDSGEEEEVVRTRILFILLEFFLDGVEEVQGQISQPRQAIYFDPLFSMLLIEILSSFGLLIICVPWVWIIRFFYTLVTKCVRSPLAILRTYSKYVNHVHRLFDTP
jgi:hypothetical protein